MKHKEGLLHPTLDNIILHQMHFIVYDFDETEVKDDIKKALKKFGGKSAILSILDMFKDDCITKEKFEKMYKINEESAKRRNLSIGEDLETFIKRIKNGEINKDTIPENGDRSNTFLLCLLDKEERKQLEQKDEDFLETFVSNCRGNADVPEAEWAASESNLKFANTDCFRYTYFIVE